MEKKVIQASCENLADACLEYAEIYHEYSDRDLVNASIIFSHFLMDAIYSQNQDMTHEGRCKLAEATGKELRKLIKTSCGKDMHSLVKDLDKDKVV